MIEFFSAAQVEVSYDAMKIATNDIPIKNLNCLSSTRFDENDLQNKHFESVLSIRGNFWNAGFLFLPGRKTKR